MIEYFKAQHIDKVLVTELSRLGRDTLQVLQVIETLVGIFFNRYCHWLGLYDIKDFMKWFENVRTGKDIKK